MATMNESSRFDTIEWLNENMHRNYPIVDTADPKDVNGKYLPSTVLADMSISCVGSFDADRFFVSHINRTGSGIQVVISYLQNGVGVQCAQTPVIPVTVTSGDSVEARTYRLYPTPDCPDDMKSISGIVVIGSCIDMINSGSYVLPYASGQVMPTLIHVYETGLEKVIFHDQNGVVIAEWTDDFTLIPGDGIDFEVTADNTIQILRIPTEAESKAEYQNVSQVIEAIKELLGTPITSINNLTPVGGNINIVGGDCTKVTPTSAGVSISNPCSVPCCTSSDIADVTAALKVLEDAKTRLSNYFTALTTNVNAIQARLSSLIASRG